MPGKGPAPTPTRILRLRGNPHARAKKDEPTPDVALPSAPAWLSGYAKVEWRRVCKELESLGYMSRLDRSTLALYCDALAKYVDAKKIDDDDKCHRHMREWADRVVKYSVQLGFTPSARTQIKVPRKKSNHNGDQRGRWVRAHS